MNYHLFFFSIFWLYLNNIPLFAQSPHVSARLVDTERKVLPKAHAPLYALEHGKISHTKYHTLVPNIQWFIWIGVINYPFTGTKQMKILKNMKDYGNGNPQMKTQY